MKPHLFTPLITPIITPLLALLLAPLLYTNPAQAQSHQSEQLSLFGQDFQVVIPQKIPECPKTWNQLREITLKFLSEQTYQAKTKKEAQDRLSALSREVAQKNTQELVFLASQTQSSIWEVSSIFQLGEGEKIDPDLQKSIDINNGLYQIETALKEATSSNPTPQTSNTPPATTPPQEPQTPQNSPSIQKKGSTSFDWSTD